MDNIQITYKVPHMKTIRDTAKLFHLPEHFVRSAVKGVHGSRFSIKAGNKYLVNCERFADFLNCEFVPHEAAAPAPDGGTIRPVPVRL